MKALPREVTIDREKRSSNENSLSVKMKKSTLLILAVFQLVAARLPVLTTESQENLVGGLENHEVTIKYIGIGYRPNIPLRYFLPLTATRNNRELLFW